MGTASFELAHPHQCVAIRALTPSTVANNQHLHPLVIPQSGEQFWRDEEVLSRIGAASHLDQLVVDISLGFLVHTLGGVSVTTGQRGEFVART